MGCEERRHILADLIEPGGRIQFSEPLQGEARDIYRSVDRAGIEGMVSKRRNSRYRSGATMDWQKTKSYEESEFEVLGVERERGKPAFALMAEPGTRKYVGSAFITLNREMRERLWKRVQDKAGPPPKGIGPHPDALWTKPGLIGRVKYLRGEDKLRHASLQDVREED